MLQIDSSDQYGNDDINGTLDQLISRVSDASIVTEEITDRRLSSIGFTYPRILFSKSDDVDMLISHGVSKYLTFLPIQRISVVMTDGEKWTIPVTRNEVFNDKNLKLNEKRNLMKLFKLITKSSESIHSAAHSIPPSHEEGLGEVSGISAVEFLHSSKIENKNLISGLIHGICLHPFSTDSLSATDFIRRLRIAIDSVTVYQTGCPLMVPQYGVNDIIQSFARAAAVSGATHILNCDYDALRGEIGQGTDWVTLDKQVKGELYHGIVVIEEDGEEVVSLDIHSGRVPVYCLRLPSGKQGVGLFHVISVDEFDISQIFTNKRIIFKLTKKEKFSENSIFAISDTFRSAEKKFRDIVGNDEISFTPEIREDIIDEGEI